MHTVGPGLHVPSRVGEAFFLCCEPIVGSRLTLIRKPFHLVAERRKLPGLGHPMQ